MFLFFGIFAIPMKILIDNDGKKIYVNEGKNDLQTYAGIITRKDITKTKPGFKIKSHLGKEFIVIEGDFVDKIKGIKRGPQIITLKDAGIISSYTGIGPGSKILEAGSGSGMLTCYLANLVRPNGKVLSYEIRKDFFELTKKNINSLGLNRFVQLKNADVSSSKEKNVNVVILDLPEPWGLLNVAERALKPGGRLVCYLPTANQVIKLLSALDKKFIDTKVIEIIERRWQERPESFRPGNSEMGHTAFLIFARKIV
jgi:tRNA (adenine57-N1/adenine58-N1)-methyltransferase